ncbi:MAG: hypothetical protein GY757_57125, partial [bacterium]|nr:hypothetical protein [bacterium]
WRSLLKSIACGANFSSGVFLFALALFITHLQIRGHSGLVTSGAFSPDGKTILAGSNDNTVRLWDVRTGKVLWVSPIPYYSVEAIGRDDLIVWIFLTFLFFLFPTVRVFDPGRVIYLRTPNPYLPLYDLPEIEKWLPAEHLAKIDSSRKRV